MAVLIPNIPTPLPLANELELLLVVANVGRTAFIIDPVTGECIAGVTVTDYTAAFTTIDISDCNSNGFRELLAETGQKTIDFNISGILKDGALRALAQENTGDVDMTDYKFKWSDGTVLNTRYVMSAYTETFPSDEAVGFTATILTSGQYTIT